MRAWKVSTFGEPSEVLHLDECALTPTPSRGQIKIRVEVAGLGLPDVLMCRNDYPLTPPLPFTPSQEAVGEVIAVGENVDTALIGKTILGPTLFQRQSGGLAEECLIVADMALGIPDTMPREQAAGFFIPFQTAWIGLVHRARLSPDDTVLVLGASGSSGSAAVQLARAKGARVIAVAGGDKKVAFCESLGSDAVIDHRKEDITAKTFELTKGKGVSVVYDPVGGKAGRAAFKSLAFEGRFIVIGYASGEWPRIGLAETLPKNISLVGAMPVGYSTEFMRGAHNDLISHWKRGQLDGIGSEVFRFEQGREAIQHIATGKVQGKVVVRISAD